MTTTAGKSTVINNNEMVGIIRRNPSLHPYAIQRWQDVNSAKDGIILKNRISASGPFSTGSTSQYARGVARL